MPDLQAEQSEHEARRIKNYLKIAEKVRTGEYFREARSMYDLSINDPMSERYFYIAITICSLIVFFIAYMAVDGLYPLQTPVPLVYVTHDIINDLPHIRPLQFSKNDDPNEALLRYLVKNYVTIREEYDIATFDRDVNGVKSQTAEEPYKKFQQFVDPHNPESPIKMYQRHSTRKIRILWTHRVPDGMEVTFEAIIDSHSDVKKSQWRANVSFQYSGIELDRKSDKVKPMKFIVTDYESKRLQDVK